MRAGRMLHDHQSRDQGAVATAKEHQRFQQTSTSRRGGLEQILPDSPQKDHPRSHLDLRFPASRTVRQ